MGYYLGCAADVNKRAARYRVMGRLETPPARHGHRRQQSKTSIPKG